MKYPIRAFKVDGFRTSAEAIDLGHYITLDTTQKEENCTTYDARKLKHKMVHVVESMHN